MLRMRIGRLSTYILGGSVLLASAGLAAAQTAIEGGAPAASTLPDNKTGGSANVHLVAHIPLGGQFRVSDADLEQELSRPYAYVTQTRDRPGLTIIDLKDLNNVRVLHRWTIENASLHEGFGAMRPKYFKLNGRYYVAICTQFAQGSPDADLGAIIFDVTGLPDTTKIKEAARIRFPAMPGGFHNLYLYKHSDGRVLLFSTTTGAQANVYDMAKTLGGDKDQGLIGTIPVPQGNVRSEVLPDFGPIKMTGYHDFYVAYDPATRQDKFYGAGGGGYYIYDVTAIGKEEPKLLTSIVGAAGIAWGHTISVTPDGAFAVTEAEYRWAPLRLFDLRPGLEGKVQAITQPVSIWNSDWNDLPHNTEMRWPLVFVSAYEDGLQIFNMQDPAHPRTVGWYYTCDCPHEHGFSGIPAWQGHSILNGAWGIMVRNTDGLIMITDMNTGAWFFKLDDFGGWNGADWAMPNISSAQDWDHGPTGAPAAPAPAHAAK
jgi:hypothetical protein